jgi:hypothetical protein
MDVWLALEALLGNQAELGAHAVCHPQQRSTVDSSLRLCTTCDAPRGMFTIWAACCQFGHTHFL